MTAAARTPTKVPARQLDWSTWPVLNRWQVEADHPVLAGHFPGQPVVPGALLLSWLASDVRRATGREVLEIREARFQGAALPGATLESRTSASASAMRFVIIEAGTPARVVASGSLVLSGEEAAP
ncbi:hypothetical protein [Ottowia sp. VDI28]|uniref:hypothetical protein n=1 Tax=Ottowia sp. VDI28 TaxID=3133968 RepID=UPI003C2CE8BE